MIVDSSGNVEAAGSSRAPIFYDSNNTGYYVNPLSTSVLNELQVNGLTVDGYKLADTASRSVSAGQWVTIATGSGRQYATFNVWDTNGGRHGSMSFTAGISYGGTGTITLLGKSWYSSGGIFNNIRIRKSGTYDTHYLQIYCDTAGTLYYAITNNFQSSGWSLTTSGTGNPASSTAAEVVPDTYPGLGTNQAIAASRYYDVNSTSYYGDFASTSYMNDVRANIFYERENTAYYFGSSQGDARMRNVRFNSVDIENGATIESVNNNGRIYLGGNLHIDSYNGNDIYLNYYSGRRTRTFYSSNREAWRSDTNGIVYAFAQHRSPIYYDYNNTGYYSDPSGASNFNTSIRATEIYARNWFRNDNSGEGLYNQATGMHWYSDSNRRWRLYGGQSTVEIGMYTSGNSLRGYYYADNSNNIGILDAGGSWAIRHANDNGTYFYTDNSALEFSVGRDTVGGNYGTVRTHSTRGGWGGYSINGNWVFMHDHSNAAGIYNDIENEWAIYMLRNSYVELMYNGTWELATRSGYGLARGSMRAPIFYDSNDTGYYVDPNSTSSAYGSRRRTGTLYGPNLSWGRYLAVGTNGHYSSSYASVATTNGNLHLDAQGGRSTYINWYVGGTTYINGTLQVNFIYDRDNTAYYWNGGGTTMMNDARANIFYERENTAYYFGSGQGDAIMNSLRTNDLRNRVDVSSNTTYGMYFSSGRSSAYAIFREGGGWSYRYPDLRIAFHTGIKFGANASYNGMRFYNDYNMATQVMSVNNATDPLGGNNVYVNYNLQAGDSLRAPYFYDSNNTGYYMNPASAHSSRFEGVNNRTMAWLNKPGHTRNSGEYYRARPRQTGDTNYWTGAMGWGRQDMNVVGTWGSGFIDSWSNPGNQPSGTSHWVGVQSYHYRSSNTSGYGWQMVGGPITNLRFRSSWAGWRSWRTIPVLDENNGNGGSMYAGRYYDSNSTGYYVDPASSSQFSSLYANNWFRAQGSTGFYLQDRGCGMRAVRDEGGQYGTVATYGSDVGGYEGWSIGGRIVFMHDMSSANGIYNDVNNEWHMLNYRNDRVRLYYNGGEKIRTESYGAYIIGSLRASSDIIAYYSDMRLKDKEGDIENALDKIGKLNGFYYRNNKEANMIGYEGTELQIGLSAQDVKSVLPEIVHPAPLAQSLGYDYMTIQYDRVVPLLVNAVNEQKEIVDSQKEEIEYLKSELLEMKEMMKELLNK